MATDGQTSCMTLCITESHESVTCHQIDQGSQKKNDVLQIHVLNDAHTGANVRTVLKEAHEELKIGDKTICTCTDNARNMPITRVEANCVSVYICFLLTTEISIFDLIKKTLM